MRQVLPIAGAIVGAYFGNPQLGFAIGSLIGNVVDPQEIQGSKVGDNPMQTASEGGARAIVFGTGCVRATCLLERGNRQIVEVEDQAGKGGPVTVNERVYWTFAIGLGEAIPGGAIVRIWEGEKLVYDASPDSTIPAETAEFARKFRFYDGSETQLPDPALEAIHGIGNAHYYRGTAYVVFPNYDLTDYREQIPVYRWEVAAEQESSNIGVMASRVMNGTSYSYIVSPDGDSGWSDSWTNAPTTMPVIIGGGRRFITHGSGPTVSILRFPYTSWESVSAGVGLTVGGWMRGDVVAIPCAAPDYGSYVSTDGVQTFSYVPGPHVEAWFTLNNLWFAARFTTSPAVYSGGSPNSVSKAADLPLMMSVVRGHDSFNGRAMICGYSLTSGSAVVISTTNGTDYTLEDIPAITGEARAICGGMVDGTEVWAVACSSGEILKKVGPTWSVAVTADTHWYGSCFNGRTFCFIGGSSTTSTDRELWTSSDLVTFSQRRASSSGNEAWPDIAAADAAYLTVPGKIPLADILTALHARAGHTSSDFDVSECTEMVTGVVFESSVTFAEAINSVIGSYFKDPSEYDRKIRYISRGKAVVRTLTEDDLVDEPESSRRENAIEYPRKLHYFFQSPITHYAATKATSARSSPDVHVIGEVSISSPITYDNPDEPAQVAAKLHKVYWADAEGEIVWHVTDEHADLVPGDCVGLNLRGVIRRARITSIEDDPGVRKLTMRIDRQSAYTSNVTGIPLPPPTPPRPSIIAPSIGLTMDIPALTDDADDLHYLRAVFGVTDVWAGAIDQRSMDGGASFASINTASRAAVVGVLQDTVTAASPHFTDTTNRVAVDLFVDRDLESISQQQFLSEGGAFALSYMDGGVRKWELCQYRDAEQDSDGNWILTTLHRGLLNTAAAAHAIGDYFVLIDRAILKNNAQSAWLGQELVHRAVSNGLSPETAATETTTYTGQSQREFPVAHVQLDLAGDELAVSIVPRHRFGTDDNPVRSLNWTGYRITATDGANSATYETTSDETEIDVAGWTGTIDVSVAQINRLTGPGPTVTESIAA